jgi:hypothetical protein
MYPTACSSARGRSPSEREALDKLGDLFEEDGK